MIYCGIENLKPNMILAKDLIDPHTNQILLRKGIILSKNYIALLSMKGLTGLYIQEEKFKDVQVDPLISLELRTSSIQKLKELDIEGTIENSKAIVEEILDVQNPEVNLSNIRDIEADIFKKAMKVTEISIIIGQGLGYSQKELNDLAAAAMLHDIGKLAKDPNNLKKLNFTGSIGEYKEELHPLYSYQLLQNKNVLSSAAKIGILSHELNPNQTMKLGTTVTVKPNKFGEIIHVASSYNKLVLNPNINFSPSEVVEYFTASSEKQFNQDIVKAFLEYVPVYPKGTVVILSNGEIAVVIQNHKGLPLRPTVRLETGEVINLLDDQNRTITILDIYTKDQINSRTR